MARRRSSQNPYRRSDRIGELLREIIADEMARIDDEQLEVVTITGVSVDDELTLATVYFSALTSNPDGDAFVADRLETHRVALQRAINHQTHLRRTPVLRFRPDRGVSEGARIEEILREIDNRRSP